MAPGNAAYRSGRHATSSKAGTKQIVVAIPDSERASVLPPDTAQALCGLGGVHHVAPSDLAQVAVWQDVMAEAAVVVTFWGFPRLNRQRLTAAPNLELVMHGASSVHHIVSEDFWNSGIAISQAGAAMAPAVAELALAFTLALLRRTARFDHALASGSSWQSARSGPRAREINGARIGVIGASRIGRAYIDLCQRLGASVRIFDPYLQQSDPLSIHRGDLTDVMSTSDVVAIHAPATPDTEHLIDSAAIGRLPHGAAVVNTARGSLVDMDALYDAAAAGRVDVALDVHDEEPLPPTSRWRGLPNVILTPHIAGATRESRARAGQIVVDEVARHCAGLPLEHQVTREIVTRMA